MSSGKQRLGPDPSVGVSDIQKVIWESTERLGCKDVLKILHSHQQPSWKSAPIGEWLGGDSMCILFCNLFSVHENGVISSTKLKKALLSLQSEKGRLNFSKYHDGDWSDMVDVQIRIAAQQFRDIKKDSMKYARCCKKCSLKEKANIDKVLDFLHISGEELEQKEEKQEKAEAEVTTEKSLAGDPFELKIFTRVLKREASNPESPNFKKGASQEMGSDSLPSSSSREAASGPASSNALVSYNHSGSMPSKAVASFLKGLHLDEAEELKAWMCKNVQVTAKKRKTKKSKQSKKSKVQEDKAKKTICKKPAAVVKKKKQAGYKTTFLHRVTSAAWNKAKKTALKEGKSLEEARAAGRKASQETAEKVQCGLLKEA